MLCTCLLNEGDCIVMKGVRYIPNKREKRKIGKFMANITVLCYDKKTSLQSNGMAAIPKKNKFGKQLFLTSCYCAPPKVAPEAAAPLAPP